ncbi:MAG: DNA polymerase subunit beta [Thermoprotei archaeon]|nr:MAG: DNA polymerase subunit beta [Thermoprotei archaeon]RLF24515.1 MAG: DNA polymerase subunit beta [Thermoprotei archaeon]
MRVKKPIRVGDRIQVVYSDDRWNLLRLLRSKAMRIMKVLNAAGLPAIVHGSVARGDVTKESDIDVFIPLNVPSYKVELALEQAGFKIYARMITQATPWHVIKGHIYLDELTIITFPLTRMTKLEREFYRFGGELTLDELKRDIRVPGVDKRLMMIEPRPYGHDEWPIIGREHEVAKILKVSIDIVKERVYVLTRRDEVGRTGVFLKELLLPEESFEEALERIARDKPQVKKKLREAEPV